MQVDEEGVADLDVGFELGARAGLRGGMGREGLTLKVPVTVRPHRNCNIRGTERCYGSR